MLNAHTLTPPQREALNVLRNALQVATDCGLLDVLVCECVKVDSVNDVCDAVTSLEEALKGEFAKNAALL